MMAVVRANGAAEPMMRAALLVSSSLSGSAAPWVLLLSGGEVGRDEDVPVGAGPLVVGALTGWVGTAVPALGDASTGAVVSGVPVATSFRLRRPRTCSAASSVKTSK